MEADVQLKNLECQAQDCDGWSGLQLTLGLQPQRPLLGSGEVGVSLPGFSPQLYSTLCFLWSWVLWALTEVVSIYTS